MFASLMLDSNMIPHIAYTSGVESKLYVAETHGGAWNTEIVDNDGFLGFYCCIASDNDGDAHIAYQDETHVNLKYAHEDSHGSPGFTTEIVDSTGNVGEFASIALDSNYHPHIAYTRHYGLRRDLKYACWNGTNWDIETLDSSGVNNWHTSIALDSSDNPHIAWYDYSNENLKYASYDGMQWNSEIIASAGKFGGDPSLVMDSNDYPHILFHDANTGWLRYAKWSGSSWEIEVVDNEIMIGLSLIEKSIVLDSLDQPHISYYGYNGSYSFLKYAYRTNTGIESTPPVIMQSTFLSVRPNPVASNMTISFSLQEAANVHIDIYDIRGCKVATIVDDILAAGEHEYLRSVSDLSLSSGVYLYCLRTNEFSETMKVIVK